MPERCQDAGVLVSKHILNLLPCHCCTPAERAVFANAVLPVGESLPAVCSNTSNHPGVSQDTQEQTRLHRQVTPVRSHKRKDCQKECKRSARDL